MGGDEAGTEAPLTPNPIARGAVKSKGEWKWKSLFNFYSRQHAPILVAALILSTAAGITGPALAIFFGKIFDAFSAYGSGAADGHMLMQKVSADAVALCVLGGTVWLLKGGYFGLWIVFGELQAKNARDSLFQSLLEKDLEWYEMRTSGIGALLPRLQTQIRELQIGTAQPLGFSIQYVVQAFASFGLAFYTSWKLTLVILAGLPVAAVIMSFISSMMQPSISKQEIELSLASKIANSALSAIETVKCFNGQTFELEQYKPVVIEAARHYMKQALSNSLQIGFVRFVTTAMFVQGFWYGGHLVTTGRTSAGDVLTTFWACLMATKAIEDILPHMLVLEKGRAAGAGTKAILNQMSWGLKTNREVGKSAPKFCEGDIEVRDVSFAYPSRPDNLVLSESTFFFPAGETTFVVGKSGSGKSTLGNLLMRFYEPTAGRVLIDGTSIGELDINWLRNNITLVQQQSILFSETIFRNISFGQRDYLRVSKKQVRVCIDLAALQSTIQDMPEGLDTQVGSGGSALSGGQKQRIAVARARLRDTPVLILDESTSALDYVSRKTVLEGIRQWRLGKTTIVITHDISQIREDDFVYVLEKGQIIEDGYRRALRSLEERASHSLASQTVAASAHLDAGSAARKDQMPQVNRYSNIAFGTRQSIVRQDSIEMHLDRIVESPILSHSRSGSNSGHDSVRVPQKRSSTGNLLDVHQAMSRGGRPMSLHQAMTMKSIYDESILPTDLRALNVSPAHRNSRPASTAASTTLSDVQKLSGPKGEDTAPRPEAASVRSILQTVWPTLSVPKRIQLVLGFFSALVHAAGPPSFSYVFSQLLGTFFIKDHQAQKALIYSMAILGIAIVDAISDGGMHYLLEGCGQAWVDILRLQAFERVLDQPKAWFDDEENSVASLTSSLDRNAEEMRNLVGRFAPFIVVVAAMMTIATVWSLVVCWKVTLVGIAAAPSLYFVTKGFEAVSSKWENLTNSAGNEAGSIFVETFTDIRTVRALTLESYFHKKYNKATSAALIVGIKRAVYCGFFFGASDSAINFVTALVFWYGAKVAQEGAFSVKSILTVFSMLLFSTANANAVIAYIPQISSSVDTATRLLRLSNLPLQKSHEHCGTVKLNISDPRTLAGPINFINLTFSYSSRGPLAPALSRLNLTIHSGSSTALVGTSGSGKSTIASLLLGLYPPSTRPNVPTPSDTSSETPSITLSGHDIRSLHIPTLRSAIAIVSQTPTLFPTSVRQNIAYGLDLLSPLTTTANVQSAAKKAGIHDFILTLPSGYETTIGDGGLGLSGGQAQRIVIARALCRKPRILILDEATSALDGESAEVVRRSIVSLIEDSRREKYHAVSRDESGREASAAAAAAGSTEAARAVRKGEAAASSMTVLIITHAKEMMQCAENVVVLDKGRVLEEGPYGELAGRRGGALEKMLRSADAGAGAGAGAAGDWGGGNEDSG